MHWYHKILPFLIQNLSKPFWYLYLQKKRTLTLNGLTHARHALAQAKKEKKGLLIISNHTSLLDFAYVISGLMHTDAVFRTVYFVGDESKNYNSSFFTWKRFFFASTFFMKAVGAWPAKRGTGHYETALVDHARLLSDGAIVCIFPQGGIVKSDKIHGGAGYLADATHAVVLPVVIQHTADNTTSVTYAAQTTFASWKKEDFSADTAEQIAENYRNFAKSALHRV